MLTRRYYKDDYETETLVGTLTQMLLDAGSYSEGMVTILEGDFGQTPIMATDDETYEQEYLKGLNGQSVQVTGEWRNGVLYVLSSDIQLGVEPGIESSKNEQSEPALRDDDSTNASEPSSGNTQLEGATAESKTISVAETEDVENASQTDSDTPVEVSEGEEVIEFQTVELVKPCTSCTFLSHASARFCWYCGTRLPEVRNVQKEGE